MRLFAQMLGGLLLLATLLAGYKNRHYFFGGVSHQATSNAAPVVTLDGVLSGGDGTVLVLDNANKIHGFGQNNRQQLSLEFADSVTRPQVLPMDESGVLPAPAWTRVHAGDQASYAISRDGNLWRKPVSRFKREPSRGPQKITAEGNYARLFAEEVPLLKWKKAEQMWGVGAGLASNGKLYFWRESSLRELTDAKQRDPQNQYPRPTPTFGTPTELTRLATSTDNQWRDFCIGMGDIYAVADDGTLWYSGNLSGVTVTNGSATTDVEPTTMPHLQRVQLDAKLSRVFCRANATHVLALDDSNALWGFGNNTFGELGKSDGDPFKPNVKITREAMQRLTDKRWAAIAIAPSSTLGISIDGALWAWGSDVDFKSGLSDGNASSAPVLIDNKRKWAAITATHYSRAALTTDGQLFTWGANHGGTLGDGGVATRRDALTPVDSTVIWKHLSTATSTSAK